MAATSLAGCNSTHAPGAAPTNASSAVDPGRDAAPPSIPSNALKSAASGDAVKTFYQRLGWHAVWSDANAAALDKVLAARQQNGLNHVDFGKIDAGGSPAAADVARTKAALAYASALANGVVDPAALHDVYTLPRPKTDIATGLAQALQDGKIEGFFAGLVPQDQDYQRLSKAYVHYATAQSDTSGAQIPDKAAIHIGDRDSRVVQIASQLASNGYLPQEAVPNESGGQPAQYAQQLAVAVKHLQADYGIKTDGVIGSDTLAVINAGPNDKARQLAVALERRRWLTRNPPATRIDVNTAAATLSYFRDGKRVDERKVIVGEPGRETPLLLAPLYRLVANPTWTVPKSISVSAATIRADNMHRKNGFLVQPSGPHNALGLVKFDLQDDQEIYLHDTDDRSLFGRTQRHLSHGCVRVDDALGFAKMIAQQEGVEDKWQKARKTGDETFVPLPKPIPVRLLYWNAFVDSGGDVVFRTDPYGWNDAVAKALGFSGTASRKAQAGAIDLGP
ncbi:murein L,D-transpeptidase [Sphingomonas koreensis]|nr:murein L,D-transpeptidase [Sphingomonas koreensis]